MGLNECAFGKTANEVYCDIFQKLEMFGQTVSGRNGQTKELTHVCMTIADSTQRWIQCRKPVLSPAFAIAELVMLMNGNDDAKLLNIWNPALPKYQGKYSRYPGAYGRRLRYSFGFDQINRAYNALKNNPESRQVVKNAKVVPIALDKYAYKINLSWNVPFIIRRIFYALYELSVFKILCINISGILILKVFIVVYKRADVVYLQKAQSYKNIDVKDFESLPVYIRMKLAALNIKRYKKNMKKDFGGDEHLIIGWRNYAEMDGLVLGSDNNSETTYFCMLYKKWPRINVCCIGKRTFRKKCIYNLNRQGFDYIGCNENIMHFESPKGIEINILYGKWWPEAIEIKNKEIPGRLRDWFFYQNFIYTDENGKRHECEFWGTEEYNQDMYIIESINLRENGQLVKRAIIIKKEKEDYIMAELSEAEIVFKIFAEKHK